MPEAKAVNQYFSDIAPAYDLANRVMSSGVDILWRRYLARRVRASQPTDILDLATGSGDVAFTLAKQVPSARNIVGMDFCQPMLDVAIQKQTKRKYPTPISFQQGDCLQLPVTDCSFDIVTISFGLRNLEDRDRGLREMFRVLRPGGRLLVLEFTQPDRWVRGFYYWYLKHIIPVLSGKLTGNRDAYQYLGDSIEQFPDKQQLTDELTSAGFTSIQSRGLTFSVAAVHEGTRPG
jgi:demethylmenaquinone methyltransferase / 2-methoxy-6-polyprenyl-1,4-benzoquinol methylase